MYNGPYLRVLTPRTTNGNNPLLNDQGVLQYKEAHLPLSAKDHLERQNRSTPQHLRKKIEIVHGYADQQRKNEQDDLIAQLKAELAALKAAQSAKSAVVESVAQKAQEQAPAIPKAVKPVAPATPVNNAQNQ